MSFPLTPLSSDAVRELREENDKSGCQAPSDLGLDKRRSQE